MSQGEITFSGRQDLLATALGKKDHPGSVIGTGLGVNITSHWGRDSDKALSADREKIKKMEAEMLVLKQMVIKLGKGDNQIHEQEVQIPSEKDSCADIVFPKVNLIPFLFLF